jgi:hypothetical protein
MLVLGYLLGRIHEGRHWNEWMRNNIRKLKNNTIPIDGKEDYLEYIKDWIGEKK